MNHLANHLHGFRDQNTNDVIYIGKLPGRRQIAVYTVYGSSYFVLAFCKTEDAAQRLHVLLDMMMLHGYEHHQCNDPGMPPLASSNTKFFHEPLCKSLP